jgi:hypothetical protein
MPDDTPFTMSIPAAGKRYLGLGRNASYEAAKRGDLPIVEVGRLKRVLVRVLETRLESAPRDISR